MGMFMPVCERAHRLVLRRCTAVLGAGLPSERWQGVAGQETPNGTCTASYDALSSSDIWCFGCKPIRGTTSGCWGTRRAADRMGLQVQVCGDVLQLVGAWDAQFGSIRAIGCTSVETRHIGTRGPVARPCVSRDLRAVAVAVGWPCAVELVELVADCAGMVHKGSWAMCVLMLLEPQTEYKNLKACRVRCMGWGTR